MAPDLWCDASGRGCMGAYGVRAADLSPLDARLELLELAARFGSGCGWCSASFKLAAAKKPFALLINISDPHVPFYGLDKHGSPINDAFAPSRVYRPDEVAVPGFLIDDPIVREELAHYYSSVEGTVRKQDLLRFFKNE